MSEQVKASKYRSYLSGNIAAAVSMVQSGAMLKRKGSPRIDKLSGKAPMNSSAAVNHDHL